MIKDKRGRFIPRESYELIGTVISVSEPEKYIGRKLVVKPTDKKERYFIIHACPIEVPVNATISVATVPNGIYRYYKEKNWTIEFRCIYHFEICEGGLTYAQV